MSFAWNKLRMAVYCLANTGSKRERLASAISGHLVCLKPKDVPSAWRPEFASMMDRLRIGRTVEQNAWGNRVVEALNDDEVDAMIATILRLYDAVTRYQPIQTTVEIPKLPTVARPSYRGALQSSNKKTMA